MGGGPRMTFFESVTTCLKKYGTFNGRASRAEFWWFQLFFLLTQSAVILLYLPLAAISGVALGIPYLACGTRRLRDAGVSPWWLSLLGLNVLGKFTTWSPESPSAMLILIVSAGGGLMLLFFLLKPTLKTSTASDSLVEPTPITPTKNDTSAQELPLNQEHTHAGISSEAKDTIKRQQDSQGSGSFHLTAPLLATLGLFTILGVVASLAWNADERKKTATLASPEAAPPGQAAPMSTNSPTPKYDRYTWSPDHNTQTLQTGKFSNGAEIIANQPQGIGGGYLQIRKKAGAPLIDTPVHDDFVSIAGFIPGKENPVAAIVKSSCGGVACTWTDYHVAYVHEGQLVGIPVGPVLNNDFSITVDTHDGQVAGIQVLNVANGERNGYGDLVKTDLRLVPAKGFIRTEFSQNYESLVGSHPEDYFSHQMAREKLALAMGLQNFRELRGAASGPGSSNLVGGRYIVFNGCKAHFCDSSFASVVFDGTTGHSWSIWVDVANGTYFTYSSTPWTFELFQTVGSAIQLGASLEPRFENGQIKLSGQAMQMR